MDLIFCTQCQDVIRLDKKIRKCQCGNSSGLSKLGQSVYTGSAVPIRFDDTSMLVAIANPKYEGDGDPFNSIIVSVNNPTFTARDKL